ncbi:MAG: hypothetical protein LPK19_07590, partial [Hymenobacteraceae bacterium]|nr:hypothetical protein [Hymenobacteraceae bacterium]MDX5396072.1 hypothetical protein [Hymenobacteraceae bacterium]MDX5512135.1 hypothetical protein [Hymenobacteraceae bacterium]
MDDLKTIIDTLSANQKREFIHFIKRQNRNHSRKDVELFQLLQQKKKYKAKELHAQVYSEADNTMAYYALRKRLMRQLSDFILLKRMEEDNTAAASVMGMLALAKYLFDVQASRQAWQLLLKAERTAADNEQYDLLNAIYNLQIEKAASEHAPELNLIIEKRNQNKIAADEDERANIAASLIRQQLNLVRAQGRDL